MLTRFLSIMEANGLLARPNPAFYIYKLVCKTTGKFYIGRTKDLDLRIAQHIKGIVGFIKYPSLNPALPFYENFAQAIHQDFIESKSKKSLQNFVVRSCSVDLLAMLNTIESAEMIECYLINCSKFDPLCVNKKIG